MPKQKGLLKSNYKGLYVNNGFVPCITRSKSIIWKTKSWCSITWWMLQSTAPKRALPPQHVKNHFSKKPSQNISHHVWVILFTLDTTHPTPHTQVAIVFSCLLTNLSELNMCSLSTQQHVATFYICSYIFKADLLRVTLCLNSLPLRQILFRGCVQTLEPLGLLMHQCIGWGAHSNIRLYSDFHWRLLYTRFSYIFSTLSVQASLAETCKQFGTTPIAVKLRYMQTLSNPL